VTYIFFCDIMSKIAVVKGSDRKDNILKALKMLEADVNGSIVRKGKDTLFIKVNALDLSIPLCSTHPDALEAVVSFFDSKFKRIIIGDSSLSFSSKVNAYSNIKTLYPKVEFTDLSNIGSRDIIFKTTKGKDASVKLSLLPEKAYTISLALPKSHDAVVFTGCSKNMLGCVTAQRWMVHGDMPHRRLITTNAARSNRATHLNLVELIRNCRADLAVLDAFVGMEGNGPVIGTPIEMGIALASTDSVCLDLFASKICGFEKVPYLEMCADAKLGSREATVLNNGFKNLEEIRKKFRPHKNYKYMLMEPRFESGFPMLDISHLLFMLSRPKRLIKKLPMLMR